MRERWKKLSVILGAAMLLVCQDGIQVRAEESTTREATKEQDTTTKEDKAKEQDTAAEEDKTKGEDTAAEDNSKEQDVTTEEDKAKEEDTMAEEDKAVKEQQEEKEQITTVYAKAEDLKWDENQKGLASFIIPNDKETASYKVDLWCDGEWLMTYTKNDYSNSEKGDIVDLFFFHFITKSGNYKFQVTTLDLQGNPQNQAYSEEKQYTLSEEQLPTPYDVSWKADGTFSCKRSDDAYFMQYAFEVYYPNGNCFAKFGSPVISNKTDTKEGISFDLNEYLKTAYEVTAEKDFRVKVQATSSDFEACRDSEWAEAVLGTDNKEPDQPDDTSSDSQQPAEESSPSQAVVETWKPTTPDELKRFAVYGKEKIEYTVDATNSYPVVIENAVQGEKCFEAFESVLEDWSIGRTYNIFPSGAEIYKMDSSARITLTVPRELQASGRLYKMICVTDSGRPLVLDNLDLSAGTVTFETDTFYAFALIYKDTTIIK